MWTGISVTPADRRRGATAWLSTVPLLGLLACGGVQNHSDHFRRDLSDYHNHLRWGRFDEAAAYLSESERAEFEGELAQRGGGYQVTEFELKSVTMFEEGDAAQVVVWMQSYRLPSTSVVEETVVETWRFDDTLGSWQITDREAR